MADLSDRDRKHTSGRKAHAREGWDVWRGELLREADCDGCEAGWGPGCDTGPMATGRGFLDLRPTPFPDAAAVSLVDSALARGPSGTHRARGW